MRTSHRCYGITLDGRRCTRSANCPKHREANKPKAYVAPIVHIHTEFCSHCGTEFLITSDNAELLLCDNCYIGASASERSAS